jgi:hypothetical protein
MVEAYPLSTLFSTFGFIFSLLFPFETSCNALSKKVTIKVAKNRQGAKPSKSQSLSEPLNQISVA